MSALIIGYGPGGSGKTVAAQEWQAGIDTRRIIEEGNFSPPAWEATTKILDSGVDVWMNVTTSADDLSIGFGGPSPHTVEMRRFTRDA